MKRIGCMVALAATAAFGQGARIAVHPLELRDFTGAQQEALQASFDVMLARVPEIRLAGSTSIEEAIAKPAGRGCETLDPCLRFVAEATESLYAVFARVRADPLGGQLIAQARVIRQDGAVMRKVALAAPLAEGLAATDTARKLIGQLIDALELERLSATLAVEPPPRPAAGVPLVRGAPAAEPPALLRRPIGFALLGVGSVSLGAGVLAAGLAIDGRSKLQLKPDGSVPQGQAARALVVAREGQVASVLIPAGVVIGAVGGLLALWPHRPAGVWVSASAAPGAAGVQVSGVLP